MIRVKTMMIFSNGNIAAFDEQGKQIADLQRKSAIQLWAEFATRKGYDVDGCECVFGGHDELDCRVVLDSTGDGEWMMEAIV